MPPFLLGVYQAFLALWLKLTYAYVTCARYRSTSAWICKNGGSAPFRRALSTSTMSSVLIRCAKRELTIVVVDFRIFRNVFVLLNIPPLVVGRCVYVDCNIITTFKHHQQCQARGMMAYLLLKKLERIAIKLACSFSPRLKVRLVPLRATGELRGGRL